MNHVALRKLSTKWHCLVRLINVDIAYADKRLIIPLSIISCTIS
jgi:hypothetical protein